MCVCCILSNILTQKSKSFVPGITCIIMKIPLQIISFFLSIFVTNGFYIYSFRPVIILLSNKDNKEIESPIENTKVAMSNARMNEKNKRSPGADLQTADEQADAAYADLLNTSLDQRFASS